MCKQGVQRSDGVQVIMRMAKGVHQRCLIRLRLLGQGGQRGLQRAGKVGDLAASCCSKATGSPRPPCVRQGSADLIEPAHRGAMRCAVDHQQDQAVRRKRCARLVSPATGRPGGG